MKPTIIVISVFLTILLTHCEKEDELPNSPPPCSNHAIAYGGNNQVVIFGGGGNGTSDRTFEYDLISHNWKGYSPSPRPSHRYVHKMVYVGDNRIIMFGGYDWKNFLNDIWEYNTGTHTWKEISVNSDEKPVGRYEHGMTYTDNSKIIIFGGSYTLPSGQEEYLNDTWELDPFTFQWTEYNISEEKPSRRGFMDMCATTESKIILFGGGDGIENGTDKYLYNDLWEYDASIHIWNLYN